MFKITQLWKEYQKESSVRAWESITSIQRNDTAINGSRENMRIYIMTVKAKLIKRQKNNPN